MTIRVMIGGIVLLVADCIRKQKTKLVMKYYSKCDIRRYSFEIMKMNDVNYNINN